MLYICNAFQSSIFKFFVCVFVLAHVQDKTSEIRVLELEGNLNIP